MEKSNNRLQELDSAPLGKLLWKYSLPAVVGIVVMSIYNIIDRIFIGQGVGPDAIAGLAITFPVMNVSAAFGVLIGAGASARTSILLGMQAKDKAEQVLGNSIYADAHQYHQDDSKPTYMFHIYYLITNYILYLTNEYLKRQSYQFLSYTFRRGWLIAFCILRFVAFSCWIAAFKSWSALSRLIFS